jgi:four helix bundle protein
VRRDLKFCAQIREAGASVTANIAEGFGRFSTPDFRRFLRYSRGSVSEEKDRLLDGLDRGHFSKSDYEDAVILIEQAAGAITQLILSLEISRR